MIDLADIITPERVFLDVEGAGKRAVLAELAGRVFAEGPRRGETLEALLERERLGSTAIGKGVAIPHAVAPGIERMIGVFARLRPACAFDALDDRPVDLVFMLLAPDTCGSTHLKALAKIARCLHDCEFAQKLRKSNDLDRVHGLLTARQLGSHAA